jgi:hypothetical protein
MNKSTYIIASLFLLVLAIFFLVQERAANLKSQLIVEPVPALSEKPRADTSSCERFSEDQMNDCYESIALKEKDADICDKITKTTRRKECEREVEMRRL